MDKDLKFSGKQYASMMGLSFGGLMNKALLEFLEAHKEECLKPITLNINVVEAPAKVKPDKCEHFKCRENAVVTATHKPTGKTKRLCAICSSLYSKDRDLKRVWSIPT